MSKDSKFFESEIVDQYFKITEAIPHYENFHDQLVSHIEFQVGDDKNVTVIDLGCGPAWLLKKIRTALPKIQLIGIDGSDKFHKKLSKDKSIGLDYVKSDILIWLKEKNSESIDIVVSSWVFHNWDKEYRQNVFKEVSRVLKYNGMFINADKIASSDEVENNNALFEQIKLLFDVFSKKHNTLLKNWVLHYIEDENPEIRFTCSENEKLHLELGLTSPIIVTKALMDSISLSYKK
jgi:SAM-dependent methyltransferase